IGLERPIEYSAHHSHNGYAQTDEHDLLSSIQRGKKFFKAICKCTHLRSLDWHSADFLISLDHLVSHFNHQLKTDLRPLHGDHHIVYVLRFSGNEILNTLV